MQRVPLEERLEAARALERRINEAISREGLSVYDRNYGGRYLGRAADRYFIRRDDAGNDVLRMAHPLVFGAYALEAHSIETALRNAGIAYVSLETYGSNTATLVVYPEDDDR